MARKATDDQIIQAYEATKNVWKAADLLGMCGQSVHERLVKLKVPLSINHFSNADKQLLLRNYKKFRDEGRLYALAKIMGRTKAFICRKAKELGLTGDYEFTKEHRKAVSKNTKKYIKKNGHPRGNKGKKHSPETREKLSKVSKKFWDGLTEKEKSDFVLKGLKTREKNGTLIPIRPKVTWKQGWRNIGGKKKYYRSRWEANYARYLELLKKCGEIKHWEHEPDTFWFEEVKRGVRSYLPDFKVFNNNDSIEYHEVKGWMDDRSKTKLRRMKKYYPEIKLTLIQADWFKENNRNLKGIIPGWE